MSTVYEEHVTKKRGFQVGNWWSFSFLTIETKINALIMGHISSISRISGEVDSEERKKPKHVRMTSLNETAHHIVCTMDGLWMQGIWQPAGLSN